ncbi:MAG: PDDEXK nuclease domain-containing protein [bacterium]|jgi:predicted nuclease of restriction endonuclease-like (RecB) superfamily|nr:PDDEXK nuclease domain-containing protein [bacterium]
MSKEIQTSGLYTKIADLINAARQNVVKTVNQTMVYTYFEIGRMILEDEQHGKKRAEYGKQVLKELSAKLSKEFGKGFSERNLEQMRQFFLTYSISQKSSAKLQDQHKFILSWSHYLKLMRIENRDERSFYEIECAANNWSLKELQRQFDSALYERLVLSRDKDGVKQLAEKGQIIEKPADILKDPYILEFLNLPEHHQYSESELEKEIIDKLENFLLELGKGFTFVGRQVRFTFDEKHFKVDLVFFNRILRSFVVIDLKIGELAHQDIGQMQMYVNYYDRFVRLPDENKTVGIVLCKDKSETLVEITLPEDNNTIFASRYKTVLPDKQDFVRLLEQ